jgi:hypothetical protein
MASTASPELVGQTLLWIIMVAVTSVIILTAIAFFSYKHTELFYSNFRLGHVYVFDSMTKYKKTIMYALAFLLFIVTVAYYKG